jgi:hypothetical protein
MSRSPHHHDDLERTLHQLLRELPPRRAPRSIEERVLAEIARRAALPWWRKSFAYWPIAARAVFLVGSAAVVALALTGLMSVTSGIDAAQLRAIFAVPLGTLQHGVVVFHAIGDFGEIMLRTIPPLWLYGGIAIVASLYMALFGLGAAAYRTLYAHR